jgi:hypothetical protein
VRFEDAVGSKTSVKLGADTPGINTQPVCSMLVRFEDAVGLKTSVKLGADTLEGKTGKERFATGSVLFGNDGCWMGRYKSVALS